MVSNSQLFYKMENTSLVLGLKNVLKNENPSILRLGPKPVPFF
jgi:hypothetical protein